MNLHITTGPISPAERIEITKNIWMLYEVTREEAENILHDKENGNFLVRGSKLNDRILVLSVKLGSTQGFVVKHFIIIVDGGRVLLEDSDLQFENITSLVFHYSNVCDELPEKLRLPVILRTIVSPQTLTSLALLGKNFWNYPMARSGMNVKQQKITPDSTASVQSHTSGTKLVTTPPLAPRKMSEISPSYNRKISALYNPNCSPRPNRHRRKSDPSSFVPHIAAPDQETNLVQQDKTTDKVQRQRKQSVFNDRLDIVANNVMSMNSALNGVEDTDLLNKMIEETARSYSQRKQKNIPGMHDNVTSKDFVSVITVGGTSVNCAQNSHNTNQYNRNFNPKCDSNEDDIYSEPIDKLSDTNIAKTDLYSSPLYSSISEVPDLIKEHSPQQNMSNLDLRKLRYSDGHITTSHSDINSDHFSTGNAGKKYSSGRKFSLGPMLRKLSTRKLSNCNTLTNQSSDSQQEKKLSSALGRLFGTGNDSFIAKHVFGHGYQTDSSSWEYLNQDIDDVIIVTKNPSTNRKKTNNDLKYKPKLIHTDSNDSVYESEFDSKTSTLDSLNCYSINQDKNINHS